MCQLLSSTKTQSLLRIPLTAALLLALACAAKVKHIEVHADFTPERVQSGGIAVLGMTNVAGDSADTFPLSRVLAPALEGALREHRGDIRFATWGDVRLTVGDVVVGDVLSDVHKYEHLRAATLDSLAARLAGQSRYILVQRLESDQLAFSEEDKEEAVDGGFKKTGVILKTTRTVTSTFSIFDLETSERVWLATIQGKKEATRTVRPEEREHIRGWLGTVVNIVRAVDDVLGEDRPPEIFPAPPTVASVMVPVYEKLTEALPEEGD